MNEAVEVRTVRLAHALNVLVLLGTFATAIVGYTRQPGRVPVHFDLAGGTRPWGERSWGEALAVPLTGLAITALLYASAQLWGWARRHPRLLSLPDQDAFLALPGTIQEPIWRQLKAMIYWLAVPQTLLVLTMVRLDIGGEGPFPVWPVLAPAALLVVLATVLSVRVTRTVKRAVAAGSPRAPA